MMCIALKKAILSKKPDYEFRGGWERCHDDGEFLILLLACFDGR